jgi:choline dehydrogenase
LMRSGVGPAAHLRTHGIGVRVDLPGVGANLTDHGGVDIDCGYQGPGRAAPLFHLLATFHSSGTPGGEAPDLMLWLPEPRGNPPVFEIDCGLLRPRSRGTVRLRSADPAEPPSIELPGLSDPSDAERLAEAFRRGLDVAGHHGIRRLCSRPPAPQLRSTEDLPGFVHANSYSFPHVTGACAMGPRPDDGAVVDATGRVHGTGRLTVADASIIPNATSAFTQIPTVMLAERLSEQLASAT